MNPYGISSCVRTLPLEPAEPAEDLAWMDGALCAQADPERWFPDLGQPAGIARRVCRQCPVRAECLDYALETNQEFGVWGGTSERERRRLKRQRAAQRQQEGQAVA